MDHKGRRSFAGHLFLVLSFNFLPLTVGLVASRSNNDGKRTQARVAPSVEVWDNVITEQSCQILHRGASISGLGHRAFTRPLPDDGSRNNYIERVLDSILTQLDGDSSGSGDKQYVEYWSRQEWRSIEAHADVDENLAKTNDKENRPEPFRYPEFGHVLYLKVGTDVRGPTCVFPGRSTGGDLLRNTTDDGTENVQLVTVPAVPGRLLRFPGSCLHAVPRPTNHWLVSFVKGAPQFEPEETWGRSVILFNTWRKQTPQDVPLDSVSPDEVCLDEDRSQPGCNPVSSWEEIIPVQNKQEQEEGRPAKIWLLGNERRRDHMMRTVKLGAPAELESALNESRTVRTVHLFQSR